MKNKLEEYFNMPYSVEVTPVQTTEDKICYLAYHPELPGCMSHGGTHEEAINNLKEARELYIKTLFEKNQEIPLPKLQTTVIWQIIDRIEEGK